MRTPATLVLQGPPSTQGRSECLALPWSFRRPTRRLVARATREDKNQSEGQWRSDCDGVEPGARPALSAGHILYGLHGENFSAGLLPVSTCPHPQRLRRARCPLFSTQDCSLSLQTCPVPRPCISSPPQVCRPPPLSLTLSILSPFRSTSAVCCFHSFSRLA